jgi:hypothetical protein
LNSETWLNVTKNDIEELETVDKIFLRRVFETPISTPIPALYLELGIIPVSFIIKTKRLNFLHYLLTLNKEELLSRFFSAQVNNPGKGDWSLIVEQDLEDFGLDVKFKEVQDFSKEVWKQKVKEKCAESALKYLKSNVKSKLSNLEYQNINTQEYLLTENISIRNKKLLFSLRTRMIKVGKNFGQNNSCKFCPALDSQEHLIQCAEIKKTNSDVANNTESVYDDIFSGNVQKMKNISELFRKALQTRELLLEKIDD